LQQAHAVLADVYDEVLNWVNAILVEQGIPAVSQITAVREMAWSFVARVSHQRGVWYFKCLPPFFNHELEVTRFLTKLAPNTVANYVASDSERGFLLVEDAGPMFRECFDTGFDASLWLDALSQYAHLQINAMSHPMLTKLAIPDRNACRLPELVGFDITRYFEYNSDDETEQLRPEHIETIHRAFRDWGSTIDELYRYGISDTINHGDLHDGNLACAQQVRIFDWGDVSLTHPFMSLRSVLSSISRRGNIPERSPQMEPFIQAYLQPWTQFAPYGELRQMLTHAQKVWSLVSFLSWQHALQNQCDPRSVSYNYALPAVLRSFAEDQGF
jgi:hypothetical protein